MAGSSRTAALDERRSLAASPAMSATADPIPLYDVNDVHQTMLGYDDEAAVKAIAAEKVFAKKQRQWVTWAQGVIPTLVAPYMQLAKDTESRRKEPVPPPFIPCNCLVKKMTVTCVYFDST